MFKFGARLIFALIVVLITLFNYFSKTQVNPVTGKKQRVSMSPAEEVQLGLQSAPQMAAEFGGLYNDPEVQNSVKAIGQKLVLATDAGKSPYKFDFHVLADPNTVNAFAVPGGQIFITMGLLKKLKSEDQVAGVLGHEMGHVIGRHSAEQMAKTDLLRGLAGAAGVAGGDYTTAQTAQYVANLVNLSYGRDDELESDDFGVKYMMDAGYNPEALLDVMKVLEEASGGNRSAEFMSTHPSPANRAGRIKAAIEKYRQNNN
ncbi:M48 family metalloprotease [Dyadobacter flavalbus]|uniref:M48 family metalloprotease n=1 Tax=Dyadobacter flavalbus TaxID=2579942 RepID=A0A5M8QD83_9BACT|nr:M48 family metallopeptidase [Dyadobacter flavalbus]KAA6434005.1 M48 family metalloprotease [Dyadobacter flavalbus]